MVRADVLVSGISQVTSFRLPRIVSLCIITATVKRTELILADSFDYSTEIHTVFDATGHNYGV